MKKVKATKLNLNKQTVANLSGIKAGKKAITSAEPGGCLTVAQPTCGGDTTCVLSCKNTCNTCPTGDTVCLSYCVCQ